MRERLRANLKRGVRRLGTRLGMDVVDDPIYSPVPKVPPAADPLWSRRASMGGIPFDLDAQLHLIETDLAPFIREFESEVVAGRGFIVWNELYKAGDAELLYALLRHLRPRRVLELGSGYSTLISAAAAVANRRDGIETELVAVDPDPRTQLGEGIEGLARIERRSALELPLERFAELAEGDVLFVDTSHAVKLGSEVNWLVLEVLPTLAPGVVVHFHDVFLPYEYPRYLLEIGAYFNEQYLVHAFLLGNADWEVMLANCALALERQERMHELVPSLAAPPPEQPADYRPAGFWIRRRSS